MLVLFRLAKVKWSDFICIQHWPARYHLRGHFCRDVFMKLRPSWTE